MSLLLLMYLSVLGLHQSRSTRIELLLKAIDQFLDYTVVFHYDNKQLNDLEYLLQLTAKQNQPVYLMNYDGNLKISKLPKKRLLHIVFLEKTYYLDKYSHYFNYRDVVIITSKIHTNESHQLDTCKTKNLRKAGVVFIFELTIGNFSTCYYYFGKEKVTFKTMQEENKSVPELKKFFNAFKDFDGYTFRIGYNIYPPFFYKNKLSNKRRRFNGPEWNLIRTSSKLLNYKYSLVKYTGNATNSVMDVLIEKVSSGTIDWAVGGISQTLIRTNKERVKYARYMQFQSYLVAYRMETDHRSFANHLIQFWYVCNWRSLLLIVAGVISIALVLKLSLKLSRGINDNFGEYVIIATLYLVEQQCSKLKNSAKQWKPYIKLLFIFWLFASIYLLANYKSVQAYFLMTSQTGPNNILDLINKGYKIQIERNDFFNIKRHCQYYNTSGTCSILLGKLEVFDNNLCGAIGNVLNDKIALIQEEESLKFTALKQCNLSSHQKQKLRLVPTAVVPNEWHAWPFQTAPYTVTFSQLISRLESNGLLRYWYKKDTSIFNYFLSVKTQLRGENKPLKLSDFLYPFAILITGCLISTGVYLKEIYNFKSKYIVE